MPPPVIPTEFTSIQKSTCMNEKSEKSISREKYLDELYSETWVDEYFSSAKVDSIEKD